MTIDEFHLMPRKLGWKHEYWDGKAHITPSHVVVTATVAVAPRAAYTPFTLQPVAAQDVPALEPVYFAAFQDAIDYCDWELAKIKSAAQQNLTSFFAGERGQPMSASRMARHGDEIIGAALIVEKKEQSPFLDLLFVASAFQRQGVATALVAAALNALHAAGFPQLSSRYLLGNAESRSWHHRFAFVDEPDLFTAQALYNHARHEWERQQEIGKLSPAELDALAAECERRGQFLDALNEIANKYGFMAAFPRWD
ncbi:MAG: GNAT family N-acetyltransferase [Caldilineaceae bacterium]